MAKPCALCRQAQQLVGGLDHGAAAAQGVQGHGDADEELEDGEEEGRLLAVGFLALVQLPVHHGGGQHLHQGDGGGDGGDKDQEVEQEADDVAGLAAHAVRKTFCMEANSRPGPWA